MRKEMFSIRVDPAQKRAWDAYATKLGIDTSTLVRVVLDRTIEIPPEQMQGLFKEPEHAH